MKRLHTIIASGLVSALGLLAGAGAAAQNTPIRMLLGFPPGASGDTLTRKLAEKMSSALGENVIVENRPGAGGRLVLLDLKNAAPDGRTLVFTPLTPLTAAPWLYKLPYDPIKDFTPVAHVANFKYLFVVNPVEVKANNLKEFAAEAKANKKLAFYTASSPGGGAHMALDAFSHKVDLDMNYVGYKGTGNALTDLIGGQLPTMIGNVADFTEYVKLGKLKALGVPDAERSRDLPNVPTFKEQGFDIEAGGWFAVYAPAGTPAPTLARLSKAVIDAVHDPSFKALGDKLGLEVTGLGPQELAAMQKSDYEVSGERIKASGFKPQD